MMRDQPHNPRLPARRSDAKLSLALVLGVVVGIALGLLSTSAMAPGAGEYVNPTWSEGTTMIVAPVVDDAQRPAVSVYRDAISTLSEEIAIYESGHQGRR